jgi:hypothetical protein
MCSKSQALCVQVGCRFPTCWHRLSLVWGLILCLDLGIDESAPVVSLHSDDPEATFGTLHCL